MFGYTTKYSEIDATDGNVGFNPPPGEVSDVMAARVKSKGTLPVFATVIESEIGVSDTWLSQTSAVILVPGLVVDAFILTNVFQLSWWDRLSRYRVSASSWNECECW